MKCEILCLECAESMEKRQGDGSQYPGENIKYVAGTAKRNPYMPDGVSKCDFCGTKIKEGDNCSAVTIWADHSPNPYQPWEGEFIEVVGS